MATSSTLPSRRRRLCRLALLTAIAALAAAPASNAAGSYGWPVKPFDRQHPVRGFFGDPRIGEAPDGHVESKTFHFGIDVSAPDGTPVYASVSGRAVWEPQRPETIAIRTADGTVFAYWHIVPAVRNGQYAVAHTTVLGHIATGWGHVHLAELVGGRYVNPLRHGAITPYHDTTRPTVHTFSFERAGKSVGSKRLSGHFDLVAETWDETPIAVPGKWARRPVMPAVVRWRIGSTRTGATPWRTAIDFSTTIPPSGMFDAVFAPWTRQNHPWRSGRYRVQLARDWNSAAVADGRYSLEVEAFDTRGNLGRSSTTFSVSN